MRKRSAGEIRRLISAAGKRPAIRPQAHHVHHYLHLAAALGASPEPLPPRIDVTAEEMEAVRGKFGLCADSRSDRGLD